MLQVGGDFLIVDDLGSQWQCRGEERTFGRRRTSSSRQSACQRILDSRNHQLNCERRKPSNYRLVKVSD